jgi:hypothetical protein
VSYDTDKKTHCQYTKIIVLLVPLKELHALGLNERLSMRKEMNSWQELHKSRETVAETLTKPNDQDVTRPTKCFAKVMEIAIDDAKHKRMTTIGSVHICSGRVWDH